MRKLLGRPAHPIGKDADRYVPYLWTTFLFVLTCNLLGMFPFMGSPTASFAMTSVLAFGYHEGVAPYIVGSGAVVLFAPWILGSGERSLASILQSRRTWTYVWSAIPVGAVTLALALWSPFAQTYWFTSTGKAGSSLG